jgi:endonuclease/exonuclease/phosphatase family metal-dependent hydrolase
VTTFAENISLQLAKKGKTPEILLRKLFKHGLRLVSTLVIVMTGLAYLSPWINPGTFKWLTLFGTGFPWLLLINIGLLLVWASRGHRFALYHLVMLILGWQHVTAVWGMGGGAAAIRPDARPFTVMTHNIGWLFRNKKVTEAHCDSMANAYSAFLKSNGTPDIICTQETKGIFYPKLADKLGYEHRFNLKKGTVIISRFPIESGGDIPFGKTSNSTLWADIRLPDQRLVRVYNVHLQSNKVTQATAKTLEEVDDVDREETWQRVKSILVRVVGATSVRAEQVQRLCEHIAACRYPVIICGDFNDTPVSYTYRLLSEGMVDAFQAVGGGRGATFDGALPMLRIDYVLHTPELESVSSKIVRKGKWSDHFPVWAQLQ